ncbi:caspase family protein [Kitasatospora sp. NPDC088351]|uniref:caspase family protein n=1 Tax=unclassified Kitasatospora TaxID=2633591 RepID=UPI00343EC54C
MTTVYALLVGINTYPSADWPALGGCVNDVAAAGTWLRRQRGVEVRARSLLDGAATLGSVVAGIREHLGQAGPGDTALFWFSGHGTEFAATAEEQRIEPTGRCQALVCADGPLPDKLLRPLLDGVAAGGAQVTAVLDCCFAGGATRDAAGTPRYLPPDPSWHASAPVAAPVRAAGGGPTAGPGPGHVLLAAARLNQPAYEDWFDGRRHGVFTHALLGALGEHGGPALSCRRLLAAAHARVQRSGDRQHPVLWPTDAGGPADRPLLGGAPHRPGPYLLSLGGSGWQVDCGAGHGLPTGSAGLATEWTTLPSDGTPPCVLATREVHAERTLVEPADPSGPGPDPAVAHPVTLSALALPPVSVLLEAPAARSGAVARLAAALASAGPGGRPSPLLRTVPRAAAASGTLLRVTVHEGRARILLRDGSPAVPPLPLAGADDARRIARCLVHLARWHQLRDLANPDPSFGSLARIEVVPWDGAAAVTPDGSGEILCHYGDGPDGPREPRVSVRIRNRSRRRPLWCVLLNLTDSYASSPALFPGHFVAPGGTGHALDGEPVHLRLPPGRPPRPGAQARDWLKLIVAEGELNTLPFQFGAWEQDGPADRGTADGADGADGVFRPAPPAGTRDLGPARPPAAGRWAALTLALRTVVPG